jgi:site-specific DNA-methyltransferase (adenine-specific)
VTVLTVGDCLTVMRTMADQSVDAIVTDPPYGLEFMGKEWDAPWRSGIVLHDPSVVGGFQDGAGGNAYSRSRVRYGREGQAMPMFQAWCTEWATECLRLLKPGGHLLAFGGSRTYHRLACAVEDAGFEIRDQIMWVYGSGFPKSLDVSKAIDKMHGAQRQVIRHRRDVATRIYDNGEGPRLPDQIPVTVPATDDACRWQGWGTALKPAHEPIVLARRPLDGTVAETVLAHGTGALNIDGCRVGRADDDTSRAGHRTLTFGSDDEPTSGGDGSGGWSQNDSGRFPANFIHDGSDEVLELFPETAAAKSSLRGEATGYGGGWSDNTVRGHDDHGGSAARFFYCAKASRAERDAGLEKFPSLARPTMGSGVGNQPDQKRPNNKNIHPTVKPVALMRYLIRLVTPPGAVVLDPFAGSGTTGIAAALEGCEFVGIEQSADYAAIAEARIAAHTLTSHN